MQEQVILRAAKDPDFRASLLENPRNAIVDTLELDVASGIEVVVLAEKENQVHIVIPSGVDLTAADSELVAKAISDEAFRQALIANPRAVFEQEMGVTLPEDTDITVVADSANKIHIVLPSDVAATPMAAGWGDPSPPLTVTVVSCASICPPCPPTTTMCHPPETLDP